MWKGGKKGGKEGRGGKRKRSEEREMIGGKQEQEIGDGMKNGVYKEKESRLTISFIPVCPTLRTASKESRKRF